MNISKPEQRALHALAQGGAILIKRDDRRKLIECRCVNREGWQLDPFTISIFRKLKRRRFIRSVGGGPYRITREGLFAVRPQLDNR